MNWQGISAAFLWSLLSGSALAVPCDIEVGEVPLFMCETDPPGHFLSICAIEVKPGEAWSEVPEPIKVTLRQLRMDDCASSSAT